MKRFDKMIGLLLVMVLAFALSACGAANESGDSSGQSPQTVSSSEEAQTKTEESTETSSENTTAETSETSMKDTESTKILVAYFSATGNTKPIAETIAELTGGDLYEIVPTDPYTDEDLNYNNDGCRANREQNDNSARPEISDRVENMADYDVVLIGHPIWWGEEPRIIDTFMENYDFSGKTVVNFCTSGGSGISTATENLKALSQNANWLTGQRFETDADSKTIQAWLVLKVFGKD